MVTYAAVCCKCCICDPYYTVLMYVEVELEIRTYSPSFAHLKPKCLYCQKLLIILANNSCSGCRQDTRLHTSASLYNEAEQLPCKSHLQEQKYIINYKLLHHNSTQQSSAHPGVETPAPPMSQSTRPPAPR